MTTYGAVLGRHSVHCTQIDARGCRMEARLLVDYDRIGDILYLGTVSPYPEQETEELDYGVVARLNPQSGEIENLAILFFSSKVASGEALRLPILAEFHLPERGV